MAIERQKLIHLHTPEVKAPTVGSLELGEIAVQHNADEAALYIEKSNGEIAKFIDVTAINAKIDVEKLRAEGAEEALDDRIEVLEGSNHTHDNKDVLNGITAEKVAAWDAAEANAIADAEAKYQVKGEYEAAGAADAALEAAKGYVDGKVDGKFDEVGAAAQALADAKADAEAKYQVKGEYEAAGAAAQALADAKADAASLYQPKGKYEAAGAAAAVEGKLDAHKEDAVMHITEAERTDWNAAKSAIDAFLKDADMTEKAVDTLAELQTYMETDGAAATELVNRVSALESINHDAYITADAQVLTDAKAYVDGKVDGKFDEAGAAAQALADAKADAAELYQVKGNYEEAGAAAQALADAKADAEAKYQVKGEYEAAGAAAQALADAKADAASLYQPKGNYEVEGAAAQALADANTYTDNAISAIKIDCGTY